MLPLTPLIDAWSMGVLGGQELPALLQHLTVPQAGARRREGEKVEASGVLFLGSVLL